MRATLVFAAVSMFALAGAASTQAADAPTDPQIAHIAYTADMLDIAAGKQALAKSKNAQVREFAQEMIRDHTAVNDQALALLHKLNVTPQDNPTSMALTKAAEQKRADYEKLSGHAFDLAYAENEVAYHHAVNTVLADTLIPNAQNAELKDLLQTGLKLFKTHEEHAEHMVAALGK